MMWVTVGLSFFHCFLSRVVLINEGIVIKRQRLTPQASIFFGRVRCISCFPAFRVFPHVLSALCFVTHPALRFLFPFYRTPSSMSELERQLQHANKRARREKNGRTKQESPKSLVRGAMLVWVTGG